MLLADSWFVLLSETSFSGGWGLNVLESMPLVSGKIVLGILFFLSIASWSVIFSKLILLHRIRHADGRFFGRLRTARSCLEPFEEGIRHDPSIMHEVYHHGAKSAAFHFREPLFNDAKMIRGTGVEEGFEQGEFIGRRRLERGFPLLRHIATWSPLIGLAGSSWILILALNAAGQEFRVLLTQALIIVSISLAVSTPAGFFRIFLLDRCRELLKRMRHFKEQLVELFEEKLGEEPEIENDNDAPDPTGKSVLSLAEMEASQPGAIREIQPGDRYHSLRAAPATPPAPSDQ